MTYPMQPTEHDRERFRDSTKAMSMALEYNRNERLGVYRDATTEMAWRIWWAVEKERQLLHNLNQSQGAEISRLMSKIKKLEEV